jgi:FMN phosphatase YigB (HAD superfamily)
MCLALRLPTPQGAAKAAPFCGADAAVSAVASAACEARWICEMTPYPIVYLVDVDNTLIDNDAIQQDLQDHLERIYGPASRVRYWTILEDLFAELGYRDYLGALQRYRVEHPRQVELLAMSSFLIDYPFAARLFPAALELLRRMRATGPTVILSDGDVVFQPRKVMRAGLWHAVDGHVLIYVHKEEVLDDVERRYPADHYVLVDDKLRILTAVKQFWGERVTTVFARQGSHAHDAKAISGLAPADVMIESIADLLDCDLPKLREAAHPCQQT